MLRVLYDGWDLAYQPGSPAALHLLTLLACQPEGVQAVVGLPAQSFHALPGGVDVRLHDTPPGAAGRLRWEQHDLAKLAGELGAGLIHTFGSAPLFMQKPAVLSPAEPGWGEDFLPVMSKRPGLASRLRGALGQGGLERLRTIFWPEDLAGVAPAHAARDRRILPVAVHPDFSPGPDGSAGPFLAEETLSGPPLPETFILHHWSGEPGGLSGLLAAWSWAAGAIGEYHPLLVAGLSQAEGEAFDRLAAQFQVQKTARRLPVLSLPALAGLYRASTAVFHPGRTLPWGSSLRLALACRKPLVGLESRLAGAILGPAGYLVREEAGPRETARRLGAALITVVVEESLSAGLIAAAERRAQAYQNESFSHKLGEAYRSLV